MSCRHSGLRSWAAGKPRYSQGRSGDLPPTKGTVYLSPGEFANRAGFDSLQPHFQKYKEEPMKNMFYFGYLITMLFVVVLVELFNLACNHTIRRKPIKRFEL